MGTEPPTVAPSQYPTPSPTKLFIVEMDTGEPTYEAILDENFGLTIDLTKYESTAPSESPTINFTDEPTAAPSHYPTTAPTENFIADMMAGLDDDILLSVLGDLQ